MVCLILCCQSLLGTRTAFPGRCIVTLLKNKRIAERAVALKRKIAPFMLRCTKGQVATDLPDKTEILATAQSWKSDQRNLYESIRLVMETEVRELFLRKGVAASQIEFLDALLKLRQACWMPAGAN